MSMSDDVGICNAALIGVGEETITALSDSNKRAEACNERYTDLRDAVLIAHPWNFAIKTEQLIDQTLIANGKFTTGIQSWTDSSESTSSIAWNKDDKNVTLTAIYNAAAKTAFATQAFTLSATTTVTYKAKQITTDAADETTDNYVGIGTTATNVDQSQTYFDSLNPGEEIEVEVTLTAGTYYLTLATYCSVAAATYVTEFDNISLVDYSAINEDIFYDNKFAMPSDWLRIYDTDMDQENFKIQGQFLFSDSGEVKIRYIAQITTVSEMELLYKEALAARIGMELATHLVDSDARLKLMAALYKEKMREARFVDSQQGTPDDLPNGRWLDSRYGFTNSLTPINGR